MAKTPHSIPVYFKRRRDVTISSYSAGALIVSGMDLDKVEPYYGDLWKYTFTGSPAVQAVHDAKLLTVSGDANAGNNGAFFIEESLPAENALVVENVSGVLVASGSTGTGVLNEATPSYSSDQWVKGCLFNSVILPRQKKVTIKDMLVAVQTTQNLLETDSLIDFVNIYLCRSPINPFARLYGDGSGLTINAYSDRTGTPSLLSTAASIRDLKLRPAGGPIQQGANFPKGYNLYVEAGAADFAGFQALDLDQFAQDMRILQAFPCPAAGSIAPVPGEIEVQAEQEEYLLIFATISGYNDEATDQTVVGRLLFTMEDQ